MVNNEAIPAQPCLEDIANGLRPSIGIGGGGHACVIAAVGGCDVGGIADILIERRINRAKNDEGQCHQTKGEGYNHHHPRQISE